jgi:DNA alkylation repair enzyme
MPKAARVNSSKLRSHKLTTAAASGRAATCSASLVDRVVNGLHERADPQTKAWLTNYVKGSSWIGCKMPTVRAVVKSEVPKNISSDALLNSCVTLLQNEAGDAKLAGILLVSEVLPVDGDVALSHCILDRLEADILPHHITNWCTADGVATKVLQRLVLTAGSEGNHSVAMRNLNFSRHGTNFWYRRCGIVSFVNYYKHRSKLPADIGTRLIQAAEYSLLASPEERFTQTGIAWVLRFALLEPEDRNATLAMIVRHGDLWTVEAKKSLMEKLHKSDPKRTQILALGKS